MSSPVEAAGQKQARFGKGGGSYASANDARLHFGLNTADKIDRVKVTWPSGQTQEWANLRVDRYWRLVEGEKQAQPPKGAAQ